VTRRLQRVALFYGTRPQIIKSSVLRRALERDGEVLAVDTGQHYDYELNALLYQQLGVAPPDRFLEVGSGSHADQTAAVLMRAASVLQRAEASAVVVIGDTNSTLGAALAAAKQRIPVVHVEAGLRAADRLMAEEINRRVVDAVADLLCTPCERATTILNRERPDARVIQTGDVTRDVMLEHEKRASPAAEAVADAVAPYVYCTLHRAELTEDPSLLRAVLTALGSLDQTVILPLHPRSRAALGGRIQAGEFGQALKIVAPVGYLESVSLTKGANAVVTDSGGVQREAYWLGVPCITLRGETEWVETVQLGANQLLHPAEAASSLKAVLAACTNAVHGTWSRDAYGTGDAADKVAVAVRELLDA